MDTDYSDLTKSELEELAAERGLEVTRADGERGEPLVSDYVDALEAHDKYTAALEDLSDLVEEDEGGASDSGSDEEEAADEAGDQEADEPVDPDPGVAPPETDDSVLRAPAPADDIPNEGDRVKVELDDGQEHEAFLRSYRMGAVLELRDGANTMKFVRASDVKLVARVPAPAPAEA